VTELRRDVTAGLLCLAVGVAVAIRAQTFPTLREYAGPGLFPTIIGVLLAVCGGLLLVRAVYRYRRWGPDPTRPAGAASGVSRDTSVTRPTTTARAPDPSGPTAPGPSPPGPSAPGPVPALAAAQPTRRRAVANAVAIVLSVPLYLVLAPRLGFLITSGLLAFGLMQVLRVGLLRSVVVSAGLAATVTYLFGEVLRVSLPGFSLW
jgi:hypothetical protein